MSIGSNDLVQYLMAADRDNPKVSHPAPAAQPPGTSGPDQHHHGLQCHRHAGDVVRRDGRRSRAFVLLYGMGLRSFSMSPAFIPIIKDLAGHLTRKRAQCILPCVFEIKTIAGVQRFMVVQIAEIAPNLKLLDSN